MARLCWKTGRPTSLPSVEAASSTPDSSDLDGRWAPGTVPRASGSAFALSLMFVFALHVRAAEQPVKGIPAKRRSPPSVPGGHADPSIAPKQAAIPAIPLRGAIANGADPNIERFARQCRPQIESLVKTELALVRRVVHPTAEQQAQILATLDAAVDQVTLRFARGMMSRDRAIHRESPRDMIVSELAERFQAALTAEQRAAYRREVEQRIASERRLVLQTYVVLLDEHLTLTTLQRDEIFESLSRNWQGGWNASFSMLQSTSSNLPSLPDSSIVPYLTAAQRAIWQNARKVSYSSVQIPLPLAVLHDFGDEAQTDHPSGRIGDVQDP